MRKAFLQSFFATFLVFSGVNVAQSSPITFYFDGVIDSVADQLGELDGSVATGTTFSGSYTFESTEPDGQPSDLTRGEYAWRNENGGDFFFNATIGNYSFETYTIDPSAQITVLNNDPYFEDAYLMASQFIQTAGPTFPLFYPNPDPDGKQMNPVGNFSIDLISSNLDTITSDTLPLIPPDIDLFQSCSNCLLGSNLVTFQDALANKVIRGSLTSLSIDPVSLFDGKVTSDQEYIHEIVLGDKLSFDFFWDMGIEPTEFNFDILGFRGDHWEVLGADLNFGGSSTDWENYLMDVPDWAIGQEIELMFSVHDFGQQTDPTVYLKNIESVASVPEPSTLLLMATGLAGLGFASRKRKKV